MSVTEAGRLHSGASLSNTKELGSTQHPPSEENNTRREIDDLKAKVDELQRTSSDIPRVVEERLGKVDVQDSKHRLHLRGLGNLQWSGLSALTKFKKLRKLVSCQFLANFSNFNLTFGNYLLWDTSNRVHLSSVCSLFLCLVETITTKPSLPLYLC